MIDTGRCERHAIASSRCEHHVSNIGRCERHVIASGRCEHHVIDCHVTDMSLTLIGVSIM